ncbi:hypothetical protein L9F63_022939 [Diploptera punctata]|uniref:CRAL-TRIO domain-containing protein n=1 Tax=Diploptera punctata TaxID=6984 RepID=A0AAD8E9X3_DIPPU|nr:hypothetical protein L9F63_022939 [Diploptera punctata]
MSLVTPTDEVIAAVRAEFGLDQCGINEAVLSLKTWLAMQPHLPQNIDDSRLERWLIRCKNSLEKTKNSIDMYYTLKNEIPEILCNRDPSEPWFKNICNVGYGCPLPHLTPENNRVIVMGLLPSNPEMLIMNDILKMQFMILDIRMCEDYSTSDIYVMDYKHFTMAHITKITLTIIKKMEVCAMKGFNMRIKEIHLINIPQFGEILVNVLKTVLNDKIASRIHVHSKGLSSLHEKIPKKILPTEFGGQNGPVLEHWSAWLKKLESYREWFLEQDKYKSDESKRHGKAVQSCDLFGFEGSFRKLNVD